MTNMTQPVIQPGDDELTAPYWSAAREGIVSLQICGECGHVWHPPEPRCPSCRGNEISWIASSGRGVVHSFTVVHHAVHAAVTGRTPYVVALVKLDEGPRVICNVVGCEPSAVAVGMRIRFALAEAAAGSTLPQAFLTDPSTEGTT
jgi:uncharacterized OB-fold protein